MDFGELRSVLQAPPDETSWAKLCDLLERLPDHELEQVALPYAEAHVSRWADLHRHAPWVWLQELFAGKPRAYLRLVRALDLRGRKLRLDQIERLLAAPALADVTHLYLQDNRLDAAAAALLASGGGLKRLRVLSLSRNLIGDDGLRELAQAPWIAHLEDLYLERVGVTSTGVSAIAAAATSLRGLDVAGNSLGFSRDHFGGRGVELGASPLAAQLERLDVSWGSRPGLPALEIILRGAGAQSWAPLRQLEVRGGECDAASIEHMLDSALLDGLEILDLNWNNIGPDGARALASAPAARSLRVLDLRRNLIGDDGLRALVASPHLVNLARVELAWNGVTPSGREALRGATWAARFAP